MPGRNATGPLGQGPMTGRGMGSCRTGVASNVQPGRGLGLGRGMRRNQVFRADNTQSLEEEVIRLRNRLDELEKK